MKLLFLAPRMPYPADTGGKIRTLNILKQCAAFAEVDLVCFSFEWNDEAMIRLLRREARVNVHLVPHLEPGLPEKIQFLLANERSLSVAKYFAQAMRARIRTLIAQNAYDAVHFDHVHMAQYRDEVKDIPALVDDHNVEYRILERCAEVEKNPLKKFIYTRQIEKMRAYEREAVAACSVCAAVSEDDAETLRGLTGSRVPVKVVPNGVDTKYFSAETCRAPKGTRDLSAQAPESAGSPDAKDAAAKGAKPLSRTLVFTGSMDWLPNDDAMRYFINEIFPLLKEKKADIMIDIVGKKPSPALRQLAGRESGVRVTGRVDDVRPYIARAAAFVVPLRIGGGTRLKILEAMSMAKPVISTTLGAEGIAHSRAEDIVLADRPQDFAAAIVDILDHPQTARSIGQKGRELVLRQYDWNIMGQLLKDMYHEIIQRKP